MTRTLADIGEDALIRKLVSGLKQDARVLAGPGDDCAVVQGPGRGEHLLLKTDAIVEGVHFTAATPSKLVGRKALARVLSDFAAMGGTPQYALVTLIAPPDTWVRRVTGLYEGLRSLAESYQVNVVGGETSSGQQLSISVSLIGTVPTQRWARRSDGQAGDGLFVTGRLGGSIRGRHLRFEPRLQEGRWLVHHAPVRAMMDLSDGLAKDLPRLAAASGGLGFEVDWDRLPRHRGCTIEQAWGDGEDYELLFAVPARAEKKLRRDWATAFPHLELTRIGRLVEAKQSPVAVTGGWEHFVRA